MILLTTFRNIGTILSALLSAVLTDTSNMEPRIVGGKVASIYKFPYSVFLDIECGSGENWGCGASVLNQRIVLTAAHCLDMRDKGEILAIAGHQDIEKSDTLIEVTRYTIHKDYDKWISHNDIALGYLKRNLRLGRNIQRVFFYKRVPSDQDIRETACSRLGHCGRRRGRAISDPEVGGPDSDDQGILPQDCTIPERRNDVCFEEFQKPTGTG